MQLGKKNIVITGASSGIGEEIAKMVSAQGANVIMIARNEEKLKAVQGSLAGKSAFYLQDLTQIEEIKSLVERIVEENGRIDGIVHSAGTYTTMPIKSFKYEAMHEDMIINVYTFIELVKHVTKKKHFSPEGGSIIGISSVSSQRGYKGKISYCASKAALDGAVRVMSTEFASRKIRVNTITPGIIQTPLFDRFVDKRDMEIVNADLAKQPLGLGEARDVADAAVFLLSEASKFITGTTIAVDGGRLATD